MAIRNAQGTTVTIATNPYAAKITSLDISGHERPVLDSTGLDATTWRTKVLGDLLEPLQVSCEIYVNPDDLDTLQTAITAGVSQVDIEFPTVAAQTTGAIISGNGAIISHSISGSVDEMITGTFVIQYTGSVTFTDGS